MTARNFDTVPVMRKADEDCDSVLKVLQKFIEDKHGIKFSDYWDFQKWSVDYIAEFWADVWDFAGVVSSKKYDQVIDEETGFSTNLEWFKGAKLNYAENLLKYRDDQIALITLGEDKGIKRITYSQMYEEARLYAAAFRKCGLKKGDVVVCYMSNREEAIFAMEAVVSIGAIWTGALPFLGPQAALDRFQQVNPKFLLTIDRFQFDGREIEMLPKVKCVAEGLPSLEKVIVVPRKEESTLPDISDIRNSCFLREFLELGREEDGSIRPMEFEQVSFSHPVFISYTSGTTGLPKPLVHGCGCLMSAILLLHIHQNARRDSVYLSISPVGWATWNIHMSFYFLGLTLVLFEGFPFHLTPTYIWDMIEELKITHLLAIATVLEEWKKRKCTPKEKHDLSSVKYFGSGGSVVKPHIYDFMYEIFKKNIVFSSLYGGTEVMGACIMMESSVPIHRGEIPVACLGCSVHVVDEKGDEIVGKMGEFVFKKPVPGLCHAIWGDLDGSVYKEKYLSKYPGKLTLGDFAIQNPFTKGWIICGRSDDTLKQKGCRFGCAEIYNVVDMFPEVRDSLCVSKYSKAMDESAVLFLKMADGCSLTSGLIEKIRAAIGRELTSRHIPDFILEAQDIPYSRNGKKMEIIVKNIINNRPYNAANIRNPESLNYFQNVPELQDM